MNDTIWSLHQDEQDSPSFLKRMKDHASLVFGNENLAFEWHEDPRWLSATLPMPLRKNLFLIFKESCYNIIRHARASKVQIRFEAHPAGLVMEIADDGIGLSRPNPGSGNGLRNLSRRAEEGGMRLSLMPGQPAGLRVRLELPTPLFGEVPDPISS